MILARILTHVLILLSHQNTGLMHYSIQLTMHGLARIRTVHSNKSATSVISAVFHLGFDYSLPGSCFNFCLAFCIVGFCLYFYIPLLAIFVLLFTLILVFCVFYIFDFILYCFKWAGSGRAHLFWWQFFDFCPSWMASARILYCPKNLNK